MWRNTKLAREGRQDIGKKVDQGGVMVAKYTHKKEYVV